MDRDNGQPVDETKTASRADGRPPEEQASQDPTAQAETILEDSEDRMKRRAEAADTDLEEGEAPPIT
ncbi:MAG: hypothetical protein QOJ44_188 [Acidimicrobiaceae bacterium]|jgi:hypothetical protein|nr:hypothetical protein [Acidimicrobiaceae bacterium]